MQTMSFKELNLMTSIIGSFGLGAKGGEVTGNVDTDPTRFVTRLKNKLLGITLFSLSILGLGTIAAQAGSFSADFDDGAVPAGSAVYGNTVVEGSGGVGGSGVLKLTKALNGQQGSFVVDDLDSGDTLNGFDAQFQVRVGGGTSTPADGFSFCVGNDLPNGAWSEEGVGNGLIVAFDIFDNGGGEAPAIDIKWANAVLYHTTVPITTLQTGTGFVPVNIHLDTDGTLDVTYNGTVIYANTVISGFAPIGAARFGLGARTGGLNENQFVDNLNISSSVGPLTLAFLTQPSSLTVLAGGSAPFYTTVNDPASVTSYQWRKKGPSDAAFSDVPGATDATYFTPPLALADSGTQYRLHAFGVNNDAETTVATVTVTTIAVPPPTVSYNFDDGAVPGGSAVYGTAAVTVDGGDGGSGVLRLTEAVNGQNGSFVVSDFNGGKAVDGFVATFKVRVGGGTVPPADGLSFNWAADLPDDVLGTAEEGGGTGLTISFDIFDNGGGEAPSVDVKYGGAVLASQKVPTLDTGDAFVNVLIRLQPNGKVDVAYADVLLHQGVSVPAWSALANGKFLIAARTGGLNDAQYVDNLAIATTLFTGPLIITKQPANTAVLIGSTAAFSVEVNDPARASYQWQKRAPADPGFSNIPGATSSTLTTAVLTAADDGTRYRVLATGPINTVTSDEAVLGVVDLSRPASPDVTYSFDDGAVPSGTSVYGSAVVTANGGVGDSGVLRLTEAVNGASGTFLVDDFMGGMALDGFTAAFDVLVGGGTVPPADGFSFNWANDLPSANLGGGEEGGGSGLTVAFDIFDNGGGEAPAIDVKWGGATIAHKLVPISFLETGGGYKEVLMRVQSDGSLDVAYGGVVVYNNLPLPGFSAVSGGRFALAGRTGGLNENQFVDNLCILVTKFTGPLVFLKQPADKVVLSGSAATFSCVVNDPARATYQWQKKGPTDAAFANVPGATDATYTTDTLSLADNGAKVRVMATGPLNTITSREAKLTVIEINQPPPNIDFNFDDGFVPPGSATFGNALVDSVGGVGDSGVIKLTTAANGQTGSFLIDDVDAGATVYGFTASFKMRVGGGTVPPADGFSFVWGNDVGDGAFGEDGAGSGLVISFDIFDNGGGEAPALDVRYNGSDVAGTKVPITFLETGDAFVPVIVRLESDGTLDVVYNNEIVYYNLPLRGFTGFSSPRFGWGARTGGLNENQFLDDVQIATSTTPPPVIISIRRDGIHVVIAYTGILQSADNVSGPYSDVLGAASPFQTPATASKKFYRSR